MTDTRPHFDAATEEQASLYVLELLPADTHREFDERLAADPALRELVRDLQGNLDALVFSEPARPAPLSVWGRITAELKVCEAPVLTFPAWARTWGTRLLAAAAWVVLGALLHAWLAPGGGEMNVTNGTKATLAPAATDAPGSNAVQAVFVAPSRPAPAVMVPVAPTNLIAAAIEANVLRERVKLLAAQVTALNQVLTQQVTLPPGATRMQVLQLVSTNRWGSTKRPQGIADERHLPDLLAQLSADQMAATNRLTATGSENNPADLAAATSTPVITTVVGTTPETSTSTTAGLPASTVAPAAVADPAALTPSAAVPDATGITGSIADTATATQPADSVVLTPDSALSTADTASLTLNSFSLLGGGLSFNGTSGLGFVAPELNLGTIALSTDAPLGQNEVYQVWTTTAGPDGTLLYQSLGTARAEGSVVVLKFQLPADAPPNPGLLVTREPTGGSSTPTGPVVVGAP